eukprot:m51a1_g2616 hypothetical protein (434) ;mRNA; f:520900-522416
MFSTLGRVLWGPEDIPDFDDGPQEAAPSSPPPPDDPGPPDPPLATPEPPPPAAHVEPGPQEPQQPAEEPQQPARAEQQRHEAREYGEHRWGAPPGIEASADESTTASLKALSTIEEGLREMLASPGAAEAAHMRESLRRRRVAADEAKRSIERAALAAASEAALENARAVASQMEEDSAIEAEQAGLSTILTPRKPSPKVPPPPVTPTRAPAARKTPGHRPTMSTPVKKTPQVASPLLRAGRTMGTPKSTALSSPGRTQDESALSMVSAASDARKASTPKRTAVRSPPGSMSPNPLSPASTGSTGRKAATPKSGTLGSPTGDPFLTAPSPLSSPGMKAGTPKSTGPAMASPSKMSLEPGDPTKPWSPAFSMSFRTAKPAGSAVVPGPGTYNLRGKIDRGGVTIAGRHTSTRSDSGTPGPGQYELPSAFGRPRK